ncbi:alcohol dehydrogenase [Caballeronia fortuita]|uniref:Alcohol dehydrogenase n=1 Tax=Caballeronia fortuita TaxID=1777138 RepID=A0A158CMS9_9BURK|nr:hypothetical protein [Caballeronia fortuita]SAK83703.1 alcohol dehydrogenase [Caballeronia fortuita]
MKALIWHCKKDIQYDTGLDPRIEHGRDAIIEVSICGSDFHLVDGFMPGMKPGGVMRQEFIGKWLKLAETTRR